MFLDKVDRDTQIECEETPGSSLLSFRQLKLSPMDMFLDKVEDNGDKVFHSFEIYDNAHEVGVDVMSDFLESRPKECE